MTIRILADREPYSTYAEVVLPKGDMEFLGSPKESFVVLNGPAGLDESPPDILVMPAEDFLYLRFRPWTNPCVGMLFIPYGPVALMEKAFDHGCADYLREPWALPELRARAIRFFKLKFQAGDKKLELRGRRLTGGVASAELTESESSFLRLLVLNAPLPVPRNVAISALSSLMPRENRALGRCVISLRRKLELVEPGLGQRLRVVRAFGYRLDIASCG